MNDIIQQLKTEIYRIDRILEGIEYCNKLRARSTIYHAPFESLAWDAEILKQIKEDWERIIENR